MTEAVLRNPVIPGFMPDPSICRVGEDYYLAASSFEYFPGVPIWHSRDLVHWELIGNALDRPDQLRLPPDMPSSGGVYAPTLRHHDGRFYLATTVVGGAGNIIVTSEDPAGPWSKPVLVDLPGIDPDLAWDDNGDCWYTRAGVSTVRIDPDTGTVFGEPVSVWSGTGLRAPEGPHLHHIGRYWYLLIAEGGTERSHAISVARGTSPQGPFEPCPSNPLLTHSGHDHPFQNTGHGDLVQAHDGTWWMVLLGVRPRGRTPYFHGLGREVFLAPVRWEDDWPVVGPLQEQGPAPALTSTEAPPPEPATDHFDGDRLAAHWVSVRERDEEAVRLDERPGWLTLHARGTTLDRPGTVFVGRRQRHPDCTVRARVDATGGQGGLVVRMDEAHHYEVEADPDSGELRVIARIGPLRQVVGRGPLPGEPVLRVDFRTSDILPPSLTEAPGPGDDPTGTEPGAPDTISLGYESDGRHVVLAELDGRYLTSEVTTGFTGRVIGMYVTEGTVAFDWFAMTHATDSTDAADAADAT
ncbi:glycoside hydrolase family 43 protein [Streptomyces poonensis]|uniref:Glycoside hydrolase 43 family protein n=1 Tax=Streptomyces poonensis TaxID=68255 RepID=A0A918PBM9_9ACTN|nr:glycoside hydrolase family 43 protein [Streptomyces poonensis]GGY98333.1 glycoside hydrolase 43 family protein [Streptomyces poonensis]